jgi:hypothetical protein
MKTKTKPAAISTRQPEVTVEYDTAKGRTTKHFEDAVEAKKFFVAKSNAKKNPKVVGGKPGDEPVQAPVAAEQPPAAAEKPAPAKRKKAGKRAAKRAARRQAADVRQGPRITVPAAAAIVLHAAGLDGPVTDEMVVRVGELVGRQNAYQDVFVLRQSRLAIRAYLAAAKQ